MDGDDGKSERLVPRPESGPDTAQLSDAASTSGPILVRTQKIFRLSANTRGYQPEPAQMSFTLFNMM